MILLNELTNQEPSDALEASFSKSGGERKRFEYGAAVLFLDVEKHPELKCIADDDIDDEVNGPLLKPLARDAFNFKDLIFPLVD